MNCIHKNIQSIFRSIGSNAVGVFPKQASLLHYFKLHYKYLRAGMSSDVKSLLILAHDGMADGKIIDLEGQLKARHIDHTCVLRNRVAM
jgi:hypothetical protein